MAKATIGSMGSIDCSLGRVPYYKGSVIICWACGSTSGRKSPQQVMPGALTRVLDYETEEVIPVAEITVHAKTGDLMTADLAVYLDDHGEIMRDVNEIGKLAAVPATFPFLVGEMRVQ